MSKYYTAKKILTYVHKLFVLNQVQCMQEYRMAEADLLYISSV